MSGSSEGHSTDRLSVARAMLAIAGLVVGSGGLYVAIWTVLGYVLH